MSDLSRLSAASGRFCFIAVLPGSDASTRNITIYVLHQTQIGLYLYHRFLEMILFIFFIAVNLGNIIVSYSTLYKSPEAAYLMTKPLPSVSLFVIKFFDNFWLNSRVCRDLSMV